MHLKKYISISFLIASPFILTAQYLTGIATYYSDSFVEWQLFTEVEDEIGELKLQWDDDWSEWDYRLNETFGNIKLKWKDKPDEWELRGNNKIVLARTLWRGDFTEWRITDNKTTFTLQSKWKNQFDEWRIRSSKHGSFEMQANWEQDPRDWNIFDDLDEDVSYEMKMMMVFIVVFHSSPRQ